MNNFNGVINLNGNAGNISITHTLIFAGTCVQTLHGTITVSQQSIFDLASSSKLVPCSNTPSTDPHRPWFNIKSGVGDVVITLTTNLSNLLLDANTNNGKITDDFNLSITTSDGSDSYHGPIMPNTNPTASLYVAASTGNIFVAQTVIMSPLRLPGYFAPCRPPLSDSSPLRGSPGWCVVAGWAAPKRPPHTNGLRSAVGAEGSDSEFSNGIF